MAWLLPSFNELFCLAKLNPRTSPFSLCYDVILKAGWTLLSLLIGLKWEICLLNSCERFSNMHLNLPCINGADGACIHDVVTGKKAIGVCFCVWILCCMVLHLLLCLRTLIRCRRLTVLTILLRYVLTSVTFSLSHLTWCSNYSTDVLKLYQYVIILRVMISCQKLLSCWWTKIQEL